MGDPVTAPPTLYRVELREMCAAVLRTAATLAGSNVFTARSWPADPSILPAVWITAPEDDADSMGRGNPDFVRTASIAVRGIVSADTPDGAMRQIDALGAQIEHALMTSVELQQMIQQVAFIRSRAVVDSENGQHVGEIQILLGLEYAETWELAGEPLKAVSGQMTKGEAPPYPPPV